MKLETDISKIEELTRQKEPDHRRYQSMLKTCDLTDEEIDAIVHRHLKAVTEQIECQECANCCKVLRPLLKAEDIKRLADRLKMSTEHVIAEYLVEYGDNSGHGFKVTPCPFLVDNACTVYPARPDGCRLYPNLASEGFVCRLDHTFANCSICPIVYNVYVRVMKEACDTRIDPR
jgi:Fe-S-cluster containining protein